MEEQTKRRAGRSIVIVPPGEKATLGIRATPDLKRELVNAARNNGASLSEECVSRLKLSLAYESAFGNRELLNMAALLTGAFRLAGRAEAERMRRRDLAEGDAWMANRRCYEAAMRAAIVQLWLRYPGDYQAKDLTRVDNLVRSNLQGRLINTQPFEEGARS